jgi:hypothetical protein
MRRIGWTGLEGLDSLEKLWGLKNKQLWRQVERKIGT